MLNLEGKKILNMSTPKRKDYKRVINPYEGCERLNHHRWAKGNHASSMNKHTFHKYTFQEIIYSLMKIVGNN